MKMSFDQRCSRILEASHIVYSDDYTVHLVDGIETHMDEVFVRCKDGMVYRDLDVFTLDEAADMEKQMINLCKQLSIKYHD
jgi:hypothetical protein